MEKTIVKEVVVGENKKEKLWSMNFFLLWQGQLVSRFGDSIYTIAIGYWILLITGSTALMGVLSAAAVLPRIFVSPFAGTFVDRHNRKKILIVTDIIRGITITIVGISAIMGVMNHWIVLVAAIIIGICSCFFGPAINSAIPDIVPKSRLVNANSALSSIYTANGIMGNMMGGYLIQVLGAPILFTFNGLSYIFSAITECFIKIPHIEHDNKQKKFWDDMVSGIKYVKDFAGLKHLYIVIAFLNFCASMSIMLLLPMFKDNVDLGMGLYGVAMAVQSAGMLISFTLLSMVQIKAESKFFIFIASGMITGCAMILFSLTSNIYIMSALLFISGFCVAVTNSLLQSSMQSSVAPNMRSKVFAFRSTLSSSLMPIAMLVGGVLAEFISINIIILVNYIIILILFIIISSISSVKNLVNI